MEEISLAHLTPRHNWRPDSQIHSACHIMRKMVRINAMPDHIFQPSRRTLLTGLGALALCPPAAAASAEEPLSAALRAKPGLLALRDGEPATAVCSLGDQPLRFKRGDRPQIAVANDLPVPIVLNWRGLEGISATEPLLGTAPLRPAASAAFQFPLRHAGTYLCDIALLGDGAAQASRALPLIVMENEPASVDRDETFLIEGWRLKPDGSAIAPGLDPEGTASIYTVNGLVSREITVRAGERLRIRFINALQRNVIALKIESHQVRVMALDGQPAEPFLARGGAFALAPGGRADVFVDVAAASGDSSILMHDGEAARPIARLIASTEPPIRAEMLPSPPPLPSNGLPARLDLKAALRIDIPLGADQANWLSPATFAATTPAAFRAKAGRTIVLSLTNRAQATSIFHLHGHHFRLLDRLDDGWKPFWLDTLAIDAGQTQRIAFAAEYAGRWLMETVEAHWKAPKLLRWFSVE
jgi:FtsP/CotA-like multicopper oxidase with cupredoxin domain